MVFSFFNVADIEKIGEPGGWGYVHRLGPLEDKYVVSQQVGTFAFGGWGGGYSYSLSATRYNSCSNPLSLFQAALATIMITVGDISELIEAFSAAAFVFYMLVFIGLLIMRVTHRSEPRLFKVKLLFEIYC